LNFLLNEKPDQALEVFMRMAEVDDETLETHFALGSLFRRRGEIDRAIRVHQNLIARPNLDRLHRDQAFFALAEDYLGAGFFDRAEKLFLQMRDSPHYRAEALNKLIRIYELTHDWEQAIEVYEELERVSPGDVGADQVAHYYCELAEQARIDKDYSRARSMLKKAESGRRKTVRGTLERADLARDSGDHKQAIRLYEQVIQNERSLVSEVIPRLATSCRAEGAQKKFSRFLEGVLQKDPDALRAVAMATVHDAEIDDPVALECLRNYILSDSTLAGLVDVEHLEHSDDQTRRNALERIRTGLRRIAERGPRYQCNQCGFSSREQLWQCPSCRAWETVRAVEQLSFSSMSG
jgi:lipopolysaccharide biosynthesis regulator YciM